MNSSTIIFASGARFLDKLTQKNNLQGGHPPPRAARTKESREMMQLSLT
jgi:hypothetical protein